MFSLSIGVRCAMDCRSMIVRVSAAIVDSWSPSTYSKLCCSPSLSTKSYSHDSAITASGFDSNTASLTLSKTQNLPLSFKKLRSKNRGTKCCLRGWFSFNAIAYSSNPMGHR
jgi:hypothetical protein